MNEGLWTKFENSLLNEGKSKKRINKLKIMFTVANRGLKMPFEKATREDIEAFITKLHRNQFKTEKGEEYSGSSKSDIKKFIKQFWKWLKGNGEDYPSEVRWIKTAIAKDEKPHEKEILTREETIKLADSFARPEHRILPLLLFDSGFRIQELLSVKKRDLTWEYWDEDRKEKCWWIQCNESKTFTRKVEIPLFTDDINHFVRSSFYQALKDTDFLVGEQNYYSINKLLKEHSVSAIKKQLSPHHFRHSSATYYAKRYNGNTMQLCQRYGWSFGSDEVQLYVRKSGAYQQGAAKQSYRNEVSTLNEELIKVKEQLSELTARMVEIEAIALKSEKIKKVVKIYDQKID